MSSTSRILGSRTTTLHSHWRSKTASIQTERDLTEAKWKTIPDQIISTPDSYPFTHRPLCTLRKVTLNSEWNRMNGLEETIKILKEVLFIILQCNVVVFFFGLPASHYKYNNTGTAFCLTGDRPWLWSFTIINICFELMRYPLLYCGRCCCCKSNSRFYF